MNNRETKLSNSLAFHFLRWICPSDLYEEIEGDLIQRYERDITELGIRKAKGRFVVSVIRFCRPGIIMRNRLSMQRNSLPMLGNYFKTASRYWQNNKVYSTINLAGLAVGMCVFFFGLLYVDFELNYDAFNVKADQTYRVVTDVTTSSGVTYESSHGPLAAAIRESCPEAKAVTHIFLDYLLLQKDKDVFSEEKIAYADSSLFTVFTLPLIRGNYKTVLNAPRNIVLSETAARKYFGDADPVGQTLQINGGKELAFVTGVMKDMPYNSHFRVDVLVSETTLGESWTHNWDRFFFNTYVVLPEKYNPDNLAAKLPAVINKHIDQHEQKYTLSLEPLKSVYLYSKPRGSRSGSIVTGSISNIYIFSGVVLFVLFIAGFNFINLTTAFSLQRAKEVGIRKVLGGSRAQLIFQFLIDAVLISAIAFALALILCVFLLPIFNDLAGKTITTSIFQQGRYILTLFLVAVTIGLFSGAYPAFFLSGFQPVKGLKGRFATGTQGTLLRKGLVVAQFSISMILIICTMVVYSQLRYMQNEDLGFKKDHHIVIDYQFDDRINEHEDLIRQELLNVDHVSSVSLSSSIPGKTNHTFMAKIENKANDIQELLTDTYYIDYNFLQQYGIPLVSGRSFSKLIASDSTEAMLINEAATKSLGYINPKEAIGKSFQQLGRRGTIIGVVKDFHFHSEKEQIRPLTLLAGKYFMTMLTADISDQDIPSTIRAMEAKWQALAPGLPFTYFFADDAYNEQYISEERFGKLFICFAAIAILISCLGLVGLSAFSIIQRTREIGIRKIVGASSAGIVHLLSKDFLILIAIAFTIATTLAWLSATQWLKEFAYRIHISWWTYAAAGIITLVIAFITISFQTLKVAMANPVKSLKTE